MGSNRLAKHKVAGSTPVTRSRKIADLAVRTPDETAENRGGCP